MFGRWRRYLIDACAFSLGRQAFFSHLAREKKVERGANHGDSSELADLVPVRADRSGENVGSELKFERKCEIASQHQADPVVAFNLGRDERAKELISRAQDAKPDDDRANRLDGQLQPLHGVDDRTLCASLSRRLDQTLRALL